MNRPPIEEIEKVWKETKDNPIDKSLLYYFAGKVPILIEYIKELEEKQEVLKHSHNTLLEFKDALRKIAR